MIQQSRIGQCLISAYIIFILVTVGFIGMMIFEGGKDTISAKAEIITVNDDGGANYTTIQDAVDAAAPGDTIRVWAGTYTENVMIDKTLTVVGNGTDNTTIIGAMDGIVVTIEACWVNFSGFTIECDGISFNYGIRLYWAENCSIDSIRVVNHSVGVNLILSHSNKITNVTGVSSSVDQLLTYGSDFNTFENNTFYSTSYVHIQLSLSRYNTLKDFDISNSPSNNYLNSIEFSQCKYMTLKNTNISRGGVILASYGSIEHWNTHDIDQSNMVTGKPIYYLKNQKYQTVPSGMGQLILTNCSGMTIDNYDFQNVISGVLLGYSTDIVIKDNKFRNSNYGIYIHESHHVEIRNNNATANSFHILVEGSNNSVVDNVLSGSEWNNIQVRGSDNEIIGNDIRDGFSSIYLDTDSDHNLVANNTCNTTEYVGIGVYGKHNTIDNNTCEQTPRGIWVREIENMIVNNTCSFGWNGIQLGTGSTLKGVGKNIIKNNTFHDNTGAGMFINKNENLLENNICFNNAVGINFSYSDNNVVKENNISHNSLGLSLDINSINNTIFHNNFIENNDQLLDHANNIWHEDEEGNYWSDYSGLDIGGSGRVAGDGIGDTNIPHKLVDNYPFLRNSGWLYPGVQTMSDPGEVDTDGFYAVYWDECVRTTGYILEEDVVSTFDTPTVVYNGSVKKFDVYGKPNGTYYYRVKPYNQYHQGAWSESVDIIVDWPPEVPQHFSATTYPAGNALNLSWHLNINDTVEYRLEFQNETVTEWTLLELPAQPANTYDHTGLSDDVLYFYRLQAIDARSQESEYSEIIHGAPHDYMAPAAPTGLIVSLATNHTIVLTWNASPEDDLDGYNIYRTTDTEPLPNTWGKPVESVSKNDEQYIDSGLDAETTYYYVITAFDEVPNISNFSNMVSGTTLLGEHAPMINIPVADIEILEDTVDDYSINLHQWFIDINNDTLEFSCMGQSHLNVTIDQYYGIVTLMPEEDWSGRQTLTFSASDGIYLVSDTVNITVIPVNDPPRQLTITQPKVGDEFEENKPIMFWAVCDDPDLAYGDILTFNWSSNISGYIGTGALLENVSLTPGLHRITITVTDSELLSINASIQIIILRAQEQDHTDTPDNDNDGKNSSIMYSQVIVYSVVAIIAILILCIFLFILYRQKRVPLKTEGEAEGTQDTEPGLTPGAIVDQNQFQYPTPTQPQQQLNGYNNIPGYQPPLQPIYTPQVPNTPEPTATTTITMPEPTPAIQPPEALTPTVSLPSQSSANGSKPGALPQGASPTGQLQMPSVIKRPALPPKNNEDNENIENTENIEDNETNEDNEKTENDENTENNENTEN